MPMGQQLGMPDIDQRLPPFAWTWYPLKRRFAKKVIALRIRIVWPASRRRSKHCLAFMYLVLQTFPKIVDQVHVFCSMQIVCIIFEEELGMSLHSQLRVMRRHLDFLYFMQRNLDDEGSDYSFHFFPGGGQSCQKSEAYVINSWKRWSNWALVRVSGPPCNRKHTNIIKSPSIHVYMS